MNEQTINFILRYLAPGNVLRYDSGTRHHGEYLIVDENKRGSIIYETPGQAGRRSISADELAAKPGLELATFARLETDAQSETERRMSMIRSLKGEDVLRCRLKRSDNSPEKFYTYILVKTVSEEMVSAQVIFPTGGKSISIERLLDSYELSKGRF